jgi:hypothetical protein
MGRGMGQPMGGQPQQNIAPQTFVLPNGMVLLTMPPDHANCGLIRCKSGNAPRNILLPPGPAGMMPGMPAPTPAPAMQNAMMPGFGIPFMPVAQMQPQMQPQMVQPQMQMMPITAMTPMGPAIVGYQQVPMMPQMPQMNAMMNPMMNPQMQMAMPNPMVAAQVDAAAGEDTLQPPALMGTPVAPNPMAVVATPFGYAIQVPVDALQSESAAQFAQMQQTLAQSQMPMMNPYMGMNPYAMQYGGMPMMNVGYHPSGMFMPMPNPMMSGAMMAGQMMPNPMMSGQGGMSISDMLQIMAFLNNNKSQRRPTMFERIADRRETRKAAGHNDPIAQLMQAWTTPYVSPETAFRMPAGNAYPYGYFGAQTTPMSTANYGGYHNLYYGSTSYPGIY